MSDFELPKGKPVTPAAVKQEQLKGAMQASKPEDEVSNSQSPSLEPTYSKEELLKIFDELIFSGDYSETFRIRDKLSFTLRARTAEEINEIQQVIDSANLKLISSVETMRSFMNLQYALIAYNGNDLSMLKLDERKKFVERLPGVIIGALINQMARFDHKVAKACEEGEANF